ncbi:transcription factor CAULIFLOWER A [Trifolium repens]|nr:transcription factor CAULIFLOWER A [Trifolium repens]
MVNTRPMQHKRRKNINSPFYTNYDSKEEKAKLQMNFVGNDLDPLSVKELQSLEQQLDTSLKRIRTRKNQVMNQSISELHKREQNSKLAKTKEKEKTVNEHHPKRGLETIGLGQCSSTLNLICQQEVPPPPPQRLVPSLNLRVSVFELQTNTNLVVVEYAISNLTNLKRDQQPRS